MGIPQGETHSGFEATNIKQFLEQAKVRGNAKVAFAKGEEDRKMKKGVRGKLMKLYPVGEKETA